MKVVRTCREIAALISQREDRNLGFGERTIIRAHLFICRRCTAWEKHVKFMRQGINAWKHYRGD
jgi:hypothetical protein